MLLGADDLYRIAADLAEEHGTEAMDYARRAVVSFGSMHSKEVSLP